MADGARYNGRFATRIQKPLSQAVLDGYSKRKWRMKGEPLTMPKNAVPAVRYESGSTMVVRTYFGEYVIAPRKDK